MADAKALMDAVFQSTLPARGATMKILLMETHKGFQSTLPARGATWCAENAPSCVEFQSTLPARGATALTGLHLL